MPEFSDRPRLDRPGTVRPLAVQTPAVRCELRHAAGWDPCRLDERLSGAAVPITLRSGEWHVSPERFSERVAEGTARRVRRVGTLTLDAERGEGFLPEGFLTVASGAGSGADTVAECECGAVALIGPATGRHTPGAPARGHAAPSADV